MMAVTMQQMEDSYLSMMAGDTKHYWLSSSPVVRVRQQQLNPYDYASDWDYRQACKEIEEDYWDAEYDSQLDMELARE